jgi:septum formation protein
MTDGAEEAIVLASASTTRLDMLRAAGVGVASDPAAIDEAQAKRALKAAGADTAAAAESLAELKAQRVSRRHPTALVIGADQILDCENRWFDKPRTRGEARDQLLALRGRAHELVSAAVVVRNGSRLWHHVDRARLAMRPFSDAFLDWYIVAAGDGLLDTVGGYRVEGVGAQLFHRIEGDYFTILGLPLLPLLDFLRARRALAS